MKDHEPKRTKPRKFSASEAANTIVAPIAARTVESNEKAAHLFSTTRFVDLGGTHRTPLDDW
jgi:hypothetical protein